VNLQAEEKKSKAYQILKRIADGKNNPLDQAISLNRYKEAENKM
jgi:hypothetical protein